MECLAIIYNFIYIYIYEKGERERDLDREKKGRRERKTGESHHVDIIWPTVYISMASEQTR